VTPNKLGTMIKGGCVDMQICGCGNE